MSASGVDKSRLREVGTEILLVTGYDPERGVVRLSVPPDVRPRRVSVDAIEHLTIYREHPEVGAHPARSRLARRSRVDRGRLPVRHRGAGAGGGRAGARRHRTQSRAVIGLKNHGLTITGHSLDEILERVGPSIVRRVPMD